MCDYIRKKSFLLKLNLERVTESVQLLKGTLHHFLNYIIYYLHFREWYM